MVGIGLKRDHCTVADAVDHLSVFTWQRDASSDECAWFVFYREGARTGDWTARDDWPVSSQRSDRGVVSTLFCRFVSGSICRADGRSQRGGVWFYGCSGKVIPASGGIFAIIFCPTSAA